jgi:hypothetical protein
VLIKFAKGGRGSGSQIAEYLTSPAREGRDHAPPEVMRGAMERTRELIDSIDRQWTYTHGVLSFALEDAPSEKKQQEAMDAFERLAFAGLDREQWDITWVRHRHTEGGRVELHFVVPRMELSSGKALNIAPPGWESTYAPLRDALNWENGWARPNDPRRAKELQVASKGLRESLERREGREGLHGYLTSLVASEQVTDRASMVQALEEAGLEVPRKGQDYLTVLDPESGERWRMKGRIYEKEWTYEQELDRAAAREAGEPVCRNRDYDIGRAKEARYELEARLRNRAEFHASRYPRDYRNTVCALGEAETVRTLVGDGVDCDVADDRNLLCLAIDAPRAAPRVDVHEQRAAILDPSSRSRGKDLHKRELPVFVCETSREGVKDETDDGIRIRFIRAVRDTGTRLRDRARRIARDVERIARFVGASESAPGSVREKAARNRAFSEALAESLERTERASRELGRASEYVADRIEGLAGDHPWAISYEYPDPKPAWER